MTLIHSNSRILSKQSFSTALVCPVLGSTAMRPAMALFVLFDACSRAKCDMPKAAIPSLPSCKRGLLYVLVDMDKACAIKGHLACYHHFRGLPARGLLNSLCRTLLISC